MDFDLKELRLFYVSDARPHIESKFEINCVFNTEGLEIEVHPHDEDLTCTFLGVDSWGTVGLQILRATGWGRAAPPVIQ